MAKKKGEYKTGLWGIDNLIEPMSVENCWIKDTK